MHKKVSFYTDEHISNSVVKGLRLRGVDVLTTKEAGMLGATDEEHIAFAKKEERVIFTQDEDFCAYILRVLSIVVLFTPTNVPPLAI